MPELPRFRTLVIIYYVYVCICMYVCKRMKQPSSGFRCGGGGGGGGGALSSFIAIYRSPPTLQGPSLLLAFDFKLLRSESDVCFVTFLACLLACLGGISQTLAQEACSVSSVEEHVAQAQAHACVHV
ncbi:hypothetical protein PLESTB_001207000 [Pleodorina starrii]|uniref:Uncharacterized protein n=1 Tax=Pleodorina starrii TaxID=330485 RepID=A0A9W6BSD2_9CHLO|nr:hypothetical protein PLESTM_001750300 [Pleodorina starrii]GLC57278.1 hypothetical protein PLESTB_001207000 [Pleodorina starrii]GLC71331.1 hypothetical protein PLESTF_001103900 [Pleodorina starrii]